MFNRLKQNWKRNLVIFISTAIFNMATISRGTFLDEEGSFLWLLFRGIFFSAFLVLFLGLLIKPGPREE